LLLAAAIAIKYIIDTDASMRLVISVGYILSIMSVYWLCANVRDVYRYHLLSTEPNLDRRIKSGLGAPSECTRTTRIIISAIFIVVAVIVFIISMIQTNSDKLLGSVIELQLVSATATLAKCFQDDQDGKFLAAFENQNRN
jgi:hypothetical protein